MIRRSKKPVIRNAECSFAQTLLLLWPPSPMPSFVSLGPFRPQESIIYDCKGFFPSFQSQSCLAISRHFSGEQKCSPRGHPPNPGRGISHPPLPNSQWPLSRHPRPREARYFPSQQEIAIHRLIGRKRRTGMQSEREQRRRSISPQSSHKGREGLVAQ